MSNKRLKLSFGNDGKMSVVDIQQSAAYEQNPKRKVSLGGFVVAGEDNKLQFIPENCYKDFDKFHTRFFKEIATMGLTEAHTNKIVNLSKSLTEIHRSMILESLKSEDENKLNDKMIQTINETSHYVTKKLNEISTEPRRMAQYRKSELFVEPREVSLGLKWRAKKSTDTDLSLHKLVPSTMQYVSIAKTLRAILSQPDFQAMYTKYNLTEKHKCQDDVYMDICCGSTSKNRDIFRDPNTIQLQIGMS